VKTALSFRSASIALLAALFLLNIYRAATQSLVHDEAFTWQLYLTGPFAALFSVYDANHHFLSTLLMRLSSWLFGFSELALRLPSLLAGGWYFVTIFRLALLAFGESWLLLLAVALAAGNPLVLDFLVAARGYSIALACLAYGIYCIAVHLSRPESGRRPLVRAGLSFGLAVAANLTVLIPVLVVTALLLAIRRAAWKPVLLPLCAVLLAFFLVSPIRQARLGNFYYGASTLAESMQVLAAQSLAHNEGLAGSNRETAWKPWWRTFAILAAGAMTLASIVLEFPVLRGRRKAAPRDWLLLLASVTLTGSWAVLIVAHLAAGLLYPGDRTGLYFLPLAGLAIAGLAAVLGEHPRGRAGATACAAIGLLIALQYAVQLNWRYFYVWQYSADTKAILQALAAAKPAGPIRLGTSWPLDPSLNYYRETRGLTWLPKLARQGPDGDYDYYILIESDQDRIARYGLHVIYRGAISGTVLAAR